MPQPDTPTLSPAARERLEDTVENVAATLLAEWPADREHNGLLRAGAVILAAKLTPALTATVAALVAEAEARGREAAEARLNALRTAVVEFWGPPATIADLAQLSPAQQRLLDALAVARPATTERTPTPHAAWCQSRRYHAPAAPLPCNCAGHRDEGEGAEVL